MTWWNDLTSRAEFVEEIRDRQELQRRTLLARVHPEP